MPALDTQLQSITTPERWKQLMAYLDLVREWNAKINLVSRKDIDQLLEHHLAPSMAFAILERVQSSEYVLDIGSGGGFPGIVNAILFPDSQFMLIDARKKKVGVLEDMILKLGLTNAEARWARVEDLAEDEQLAGTFSRTTSRAVAPLTELVKWSMPLLSIDGTVEALKGGDVSRDIKALLATQLVGKGAVDEYYLPGEWHLNDKLKDAVIISVTVN